MTTLSTFQPKLQEYTMFSFYDLTQTDVQNIMAGLMELPAKFANPVLKKLDAQFQIQVVAVQQAAEVKKPDPELDQEPDTGDVDHVANTAPVEE
jgi:hypothetical protein